jgi:hypothetical protein
MDEGDDNKAMKVGRVSIEVKKSSSSCGGGIQFVPETKINNPLISNFSHVLLGV